jgi:pimeloyl-ACP methyl ester carboxylesterase
MISESFHAYSHLRSRFSVPLRRVGSVAVMCLVLGAMLLACLLSSQSSAQTQQSPQRSRVSTLRLTHFYDVPQPLTPGKLGDLIRSESFDDYGLPLSMNVVRIVYHSRSATGEDVASSGVVLFPADKKPSAGGWPVIAWAHGSTGVARACAPSLRRNLQHGPFLSMYVNLGYAIVASDFTGLGTNFRNAFADAPSNATDVIASIPAARAAVPQLGSRWVVMGAGQGGVTAVALAEREGDNHDSSYLGALAISNLGSASEVLQDSAYRTSSIKLVSLIFGTKTVFPEFQLSTVLTGRGMELYSAVEQSCSDLGAVQDISPADAMKPGSDQNKLILEYLDRSTLGRTRANGPILVTSGAQTTANSTSQIISRMCKAGDKVQWQQYPELDPGEVVGESVRDQIAWIESRFAGRPAATNCR